MNGGERSRTRAAPASGVAHCGWSARSSASIASTPSFTVAPPKTARTPTWSDCAQVAAFRPPLRRGSLCHDLLGGAVSDRSAVRLRPSRSAACSTADSCSVARDRPERSSIGRLRAARTRRWPPRPGRPDPAGPDRASASSRPLRRERRASSAADVEAAVDSAASKTPERRQPRRRQARTPKPALRAPTSSALQSSTTGSAGTSSRLEGQERLREHAQRSPYRGYARPGQGRSFEGGSPRRVSGRDHRDLRSSGDRRAVERPGALLTCCSGGAAPRFMPSRRCAPGPRNLVR